MTLTKYAVQVLDEGFPRLVPHTKRECYFISRKKVVEFLKGLKDKNPDYKFRILKYTESYKPEKWQ